MKNIKIAVIGAGVSGLVSIKICREYDFDVVCFEKSHDIGGLWRYKPEECEGILQETDKTVHVLYVNVNFDFKEKLL